MEKIQYVLNNITREDTADYMAELLMDEYNTTWKMYEEIACAYLNGNEDYRRGLDDGLIYLTGWCLETIAQQIMERYANKGGK